MRKLIIKLKFIVLITLSLFSCSEDEVQVKPQSRPVSVSFNYVNLGVSELSGTTHISLTLDKPAIKNGKVTLNVTTAHLDNFTTVPALINGQLQLSVKTGQTSIQFSFIPVDDNLHEENKSIGFTISSIVDGFTIGAEKVLTITLFENDLPNLVNFINKSGSLHENNSEGHFINIELTRLAQSGGTVEVAINSYETLYGAYFTTEPAAINGKIVFNVTEGMAYLPIKVIPIDNNLFDGHKQIQFIIASASGELEKDSNVSYALEIIDEELEGMARSYEIVAGSWRYKRSFEYNEMGQLVKVNWNQNAPGFSSGSYTYHYSPQGLLNKVVESEFVETIYTWAEGRIVKSEKFNEGVLKQYSIYSYDDHFNVGEVAVHNRQPSGEMALSNVFVYLYYYNGNLFKKMVYNPIENSEELNLISEETFETYMFKHNPFPMVEILPNMVTQTSLPLDYRLTREGLELLYQFQYEFDAAGRPSKRIANSSKGSEVASYEYY